MNLLARINLALIGLFFVAALAAIYFTQTTLESSARTAALSEAALILDSAQAIRSYTTSEVAPLLTHQLETVFLPQSIPFYAATQNLQKVREKHPYYWYKEATLNPTNPRDRAADWEADIIQRFRNDPTAHEIQGQRETPMGSALYLARPIHAAAECMGCHSVPSAAPQTMLAKYGQDNGFGWQAGEIIGAQVVSVPLERAQAAAAGMQRSTVGTVIAIFILLLLAVNLVLWFLVVRPLRRTVQVADRLSVGDSSAEGFPTGGGEIGALGHAFNRMRISLEKAMKLLEH